MKNIKRRNNYASVVAAICSLMRNDAPKGLTRSSRKELHRDEAYSKKDDGFFMHTSTFSRGEFTAEVCVELTEFGKPHGVPFGCWVQYVLYVDITVDDVVCRNAKETNALVDMLTELRDFAAKLRASTPDRIDQYVQETKFTK